MLNDAVLACQAKKPRAAGAGADLNYAKPLGLAHFLEAVDELLVISRVLLDKVWRRERQDDHGRLLTLSS